MRRISDICWDNNRLTYGCITMVCCGFLSTIGLAAVLDDNTPAARILLAVGVSSMGAAASCVVAGLRHELRIARAAAAEDESSEDESAEVEGVPQNVVHINELSAHVVISPYSHNL